MVLPLNGFSFTNLMLVCRQLLFANGAHIGVIAGIIVVYMGIKKNSMDGPAYCSDIVTSFLLSFRKKNIQKKTRSPVGCF